MIVKDSCNLREPSQVYSEDESSWSGADETLHVCETRSVLAFADRGCELWTVPNGRDANAERPPGRGRSSDRCT